VSPVPFFDLAAAQGAQRAELQEAAARVIESGWFILGRELESFEQAFADYCGVRHVVGVASGLDALILSLRAWKRMGKLKTGDRVVVPANTFIATVMAIMENGLAPVLVDPDPVTLNLSVAGVRAALAQGPKAVVAVHLYGRLCPMPELKALCAQEGLLLLEDAAQAHGARLDGRRAGSFGDAAGFSFYPTKNLGALGDGGAIATGDDDLAALLRSLRNYGSQRKYINGEQGLNSRLDEIQAALLRVKLPGLDAANAARRRLAERYLTEMRNPLVTLPTAPEPRESHVWHLFVIRCDARDRLVAHLDAAQIQTAIHYPVAPHRQACYRGAFDDRQLPLTDHLQHTCLSLPMSPVLTDAQADRVIAAINLFDA
jgi:dTDP-4-amino-4,6-dideoxygalactose transaminase